MPTIRERVTAWDAEKADLLERMETLQTRLDQSPGQQQVNLLQTEMESLRESLTAAQAKLDAIPPQTPQPPPNPSVDDIPPIAPAPAAPTADLTRPRNARQRRAWS